MVLRQRGFVLVWALVILALLVCLVVLALVADGNRGPVALAVGAGAQTVLVGGLALEARRDPHDVAAFGLAVGVGGALVCAILLFVVHGAGAIPKVVAGASVAVAAVSGLALLRISREAEEYPNVLAERFGKAALLEADGVQLAISVPAALAASEPGAILVFLQNCFDAERKVAIRLEAGGWTKRLLLEPRPEATLAPLEVGVLAIPIGARPGPAGAAAIVASVSASGLGGRRVRRWRARTATKRIRPWMQALALLSGHFVSGGGIRFTVRVAEVPEGTAPPPLPPTSFQRLWAPEPRGALAAARAAGLVRGAPRR
jgi:hypothetical protein